MSQPQPIPAPPADGARFCVIGAQWNRAAVDRLVDAAVRTLRAHGAGGDAIETRWVPGSFELPLAAQWAAESGTFDAVLAFGVVLRGETEHFRLVADAASQGLMRVMLETSVPVLNGVLAAYDEAQVAARSGEGAGNVGEQAARAALLMVAHRRDAGGGR